MKDRFMLSCFAARDGTNPASLPLLAECVWLSPSTLPAADAGWNKMRVRSIQRGEGDML
jgi:hypothetical protein